MSALTRFTTVEITINAGTGARVRLDTCAVGVPYIVMTDGPTDVTIRPTEDEASRAAIEFAGQLVGVGVLYAMELRALGLPSVPDPSDEPPTDAPRASSSPHTSSTTFEFTINAGLRARVHLDACFRGAPYIVIEDGPVGMIIKPADGEVSHSAISFADRFVEVARAYQAGLIEALARSVDR